MELKDRPTPIVRQTQHQKTSPEERTPNPNNSVFYRLKRHTGSLYKSYIHNQPIPKRTTHQPWVLFLYLLSNLLVWSSGASLNLPQLTSWNFFVKFTGIICCFALATQSINFKKSSQFSFSRKTWIISLFYTIPFSITFSLFSAPAPYNHIEIFLGMTCLMFLARRRLFLLLNAAGFITGSTLHFLFYTPFAIEYFGKVIFVFMSYSSVTIVIELLYSNLYNILKKVYHYYTHLRYIETEICRGMSWKKYRGTPMECPSSLGTMIQEIVRTDRRIDAQKHHIFAIPLNSAFEVLTIKHLKTSEKGIPAAIEPCHLLSQSLIQKARCVVLAYSQPDSKISLSPQDLKETALNIRACLTVDVEFIDQLIVTPMNCFSLLIKGNLEELKHEVELEEQKRKRAVCERSQLRHFKIMEKAMEVEHQAIEEVIKQFFIHQNEEK